MRIATVLGPVLLALALVGCGPDAQPVVAPTFAASATSPATTIAAAPMTETTPAAVQTPAPTTKATVAKKATPTKRAAPKLKPTPKTAAKSKNCDADGDVSDCDWQSRAKFESQKEFEKCPTGKWDIQNQRCLIH